MKHFVFVFLATPQFVCVRVCARHVCVCVCVCVLAHGGKGEGRSTDHKHDVQCLFTFGAKNTTKK